MDLLYLSLVAGLWAATLLLLRVCAALKDR